MGGRLHPRTHPPTIRSSSPRSAIVGVERASQGRGKDKVFKWATHAAQDSGKNDMEKMSLTAAFNRYFGKKSGQTMAEFSVEIKAATANPKDKADWVAMFATVGIEIV